MKLHKLIVGCILLSGYLYAVESDIEGNLNIYDNFSHITEKKSVKNKFSSFVVRNYEIPDQIISDSIYVNSSDLNLNYSVFNENRLSFEALMEEKLFKKIRFFNMQEDTKNKTIVEGILLTLNPIMIKDFDDKIYTFVNKEDIIIEGIPEYYHPKKNIELGFTAIKKEGISEYELNYLTEGLSCSALYNFFIDKKSTKLNGYFKVENNTNKNFKDMGVSCINGSVNKLKMIQGGNRMMKGQMAPSYGVENVEYDKLNMLDYDKLNIYRLPQKNSLNKHTQKSFSYIDKEIVTDILNRLEISSIGRMDSTSVKRFDRFLNIDNSVKNKLDFDFLRGTARVYEKINGDFVFIGENRVEFTPSGKDVKILIGKNNGLILHEHTKKYLSQTKKESKGNVNTSFREFVISKVFEITNTSKESQSFSLVLNNPVNSEVFILENGCGANCSIERNNGGIVINGKVKNKITVELTYKVISNKQSNEILSTK